MTPSLHAYWFGINTYTFEPEHVNRTLGRMAEVGTRSVCLGVIENQLITGKRNIDHIARLGERHGIELSLVPSYICGLVAGAPHVPCPKLSFRPDLCARGADGRAIPRQVGPIGSLGCDEVRDHLHDTVAKMLGAWPFRRVIWDEPKCFVKWWFPDHHPAYLERNPMQDWAIHIRMGCEMFSQINERLKQAHPGVAIWLFDETYKDEAVVLAEAGIRGLDAFGCDGRPWPVSAMRCTGERAHKSLIDEGPRFLAAARARGRRSLALIETQKLDCADHAALDRHLPETLAMPWDDLIYYWYPNNCEDPEAAMAIVLRHLAAARGSPSAPARTQTGQRSVSKEPR